MRHPVRLQLLGWEQQKNAPAAKVRVSLSLMLIIDQWRFLFVFCVVSFCFFCIDTDRAAGGENPEYFLHFPRGDMDEFAVTERDNDLFIAEAISCGTPQRLLTVRSTDRFDGKSRYVGVNGHDILKKRWIKILGFIHGPADRIRLGLAFEGRNGPGDVEFCELELKNRTWTGISNCISIRTLDMDSMVYGKDQSGETFLVTGSTNDRILTLLNTRMQKRIDNLDARSTLSTLNGEVICERLSEDGLLLNRVHEASTFSLRPVGPKIKEINSQAVAGGYWHILYLDSEQVFVSVRRDKECKLTWCKLINGHWSSKIVRTTVLTDAVELFYGPIGICALPDKEVVVVAYNVPPRLTIELSAFRSPDDEPLVERVRIPFDDGAASLVEVQHVSLVPTSNGIVHIFPQVYETVVP